MNQLFRRHFSGAGGMSQLLAIAFPMVVSSACETVMMFTDRLFLSYLSPIHMSAAMSGGMTGFMFTTFFMGLTGYTTPLVAQYLGAGKTKNCAVAVSQSLIISVLCFPLMLACIPVGHMLFEVFDQSQEQLQLALQYYDILMYGIVVVILKNSFSAFFSGIGKTRIVMIASLVSVVVNTIVNYILIFGAWGFPAMGIQGAAIGTLFSGFCGLFILGISYYWYHKGHPEFEAGASLRFDIKVMKKLFRFGYPAGLEFFLNFLAFDIMILIFHSYGKHVASAVTIAFNWDMVSYIPMIGMNIGVTSLVGRYMGAKDITLAHKSTKSGLKLGLMYAILMLILFIGFSGPMSKLFIQGTENVEALYSLANYMVGMMAFFVIADGFSLVFAGALRGAGDTLWAMMISVAFHWLLALEAFVLVRIFHIDPKITWACFVFTIPFIAISYFYRYRLGKWKTIDVVGSEY